MFDQGLGFILDEKIDGIDVRVDEVAQHEINNTVPPAKWHRRFGPECGKGEESFSFSPCKDKCKNFRICHTYPLC
jgi:hypothetical protein